MLYQIKSTSALQNINTKIDYEIGILNKRRNELKEIYIHGGVPSRKQEYSKIILRI